MALSTAEKKRRKIERYIAKILDILVDGNENTPDQKLLDLKRTPARVSRMYVNELFTYGPAPSVHRTKVHPGTADLVAEGPIGFSSFCAHHMLPFTGHVWIAYLADEYIIGLSKMARIVHHYSRRFQLQERFTNQVMKHMESVLAPQAVLVVAKAAHGCITCRGVMQPDIRTVTSALSNGKGTPEGLRDELYRAIDRCGTR